MHCSKFSIIIMLIKTTKFFSNMGVIHSSISTSLHNEKFSKSLWKMKSKESLRVKPPKKVPTAEPQLWFLIPIPCKCWWRWQVIQLKCLDFFHPYETHELNFHLAESAWPYPSHHGNQQLEMITFSLPYSCCLSLQ